MYFSWSAVNSGKKEATDAMLERSVAESAASYKKKMKYLTLSSILQSENKYCTNGRHITANSNSLTPIYIKSAKIYYICKY